MTAVLRVITKGRSSFDKSYIIRAINDMRVPVSEADVVLASNAFDEGMDTAERVEILRAMMDVPEQKRDQVITSAARFITRQMPIAEKVYTIRTIAGFFGPVSEEDVALTLLVIDPDMGSFSRMLIFRAVMDIPAGEKEDVILQAVKLMHFLMYAYDREAVIRRMTGVVAGQRADYVQMCRAGGQAQNDRFAAAVNAKIVTSVLKVMTKDMDASSRTQLFKVMNDVPEEKRVRVRLGALLL